MARKRNTGLDPAVSGTASTWQKSKVTRAKHAATPATENAATAAIEGSPSNAPTASPVTADYVPSEEEIARLAYSFWEARGYQGGSSEEDWLRAEQELRNRTSAANA